LWHDDERGISIDNLVASTWTLGSLPKKYPSFHTPNPKRKRKRTV